MIAPVDADSNQLTLERRILDAVSIGGHHVQAGGVGRPGVDGRPSLEREQVVADIELRPHSGLECMAPELVPFPRGAHGHHKERSVRRHRVDAEGGVVEFRDQGDHAERRASAVDKSVGPGCVVGHDQLLGGSPPLDLAGRLGGQRRSGPVDEFVLGEPVRPGVMECNDLTVRGRRGERRVGISRQHTKTRPVGAKLADVGGHSPAERQDLVAAGSALAGTNGRWVVAEDDVLLGHLERAGLLRAEEPAAAGCERQGHRGNGRRARTAPLRER